IDQLIFLSELLNDQPLYVYIFTDDKDPLSLMHLYEKVINKPNIQFDCRKEKNQHNMNVLDDYWNMAQFDCLIRSSSLFSCSAQLLGNHKIIISAQHGEWIGDILVINKIGITVYNKKKNSLNEKTFNPLILTEKEYKKLRSALKKDIKSLSKKVIKQ